VGLPASCFQRFTDLINCSFRVPESERPLLAHSRAADWKSLNSNGPSRPGRLPVKVLGPGLLLWCGHGETNGIRQGRFQAARSIFRSIAKVFVQGGGGWPLPGRCADPRAYAVQWPAPSDRRMHLAGRSDIRSPA